MAKAIYEVLKELQNFRRIAGNKLYRESFEDVAMGATQAVLRLSVIREEIEIAQRILETALTPKK